MLKYYSIMNFFLNMVYLNKLKIKREGEDRVGK